jgi:O-antigen/teichoic acid export membrane protein
MDDASSLITEHGVRVLESATNQTSGAAAESAAKPSAWHLASVAVPSVSRALPFAYSLADQGFCVSAIFLANVMLARTQSKEEYGMFALSYSVYAFLSGLHNAAILEPYTVYGSGRYRQRFAQYGRIMARSNAIVAAALTVSLLLACLILKVLAPQFGSQALVGLALTVGALLSASFVRRAFYVQGNAKLAAKFSFFFFLCVGCGLLLAERFQVLNSFSVFLILALGWLVACTGGARKLFDRKPQVAFLQSEAGYWREHWKYAKWVLGTALVFQLTTQGYYWLVAGLLSLKDVAQLKAIYVLVTPVDQFYIALNYLVLPAMAGHFACGRMPEYFALWKKVGIGTICFTGLFAAVVRLAGRFVIHVLYAGKFDSVVPLLFTLALLPLLMSIGNTMNDALKAAEMPRLVFYAYLTSGATTLLAGIPLVSHLGLKGAVYGMLVSGATYSAVLALAFFFRVARKGPQKTPAISAISQFQSAAVDSKREVIRDRRKHRHDVRADLAPVVLFVYNRPEHTRKTVESLLGNRLAPHSDLFVFSDGAKGEADRVQVDDVRHYVHHIEGFRSVKIIERERNAGLAQSVISGVSEIFREYDRQIVLEDDLLTAPDFLTFMNKALEHYEKEPRVFSASGFNHAITMPTEYECDAVFSHRSCSWGWGTWKSRWERVDWEVSDYREFRANKSRQELLNRGGGDLSYMLDLQMAGTIDSWAIRWAYAHSKHDAVALVSTDSKVYNIGFDGSGVHCRRKSTRQAALAACEKLSWKLPDSVEVDLYFAVKLREQHPRPSAGRIFWRSARTKLEQKVLRSTATWI